MPVPIREASKTYVSSFSKLSFSKKPLSIWALSKHTFSYLFIFFPAGEGPPDTRCRCRGWIFPSFQPLSNPISISFDSTDLENFKSQTARSAVNVREGQGVVLLCGPPVNSGGESDTSECSSCFLGLIVFYLHRNFPL